MSQFVTVVTYDLSYVFLILFSLAYNFGCIDPGVWSGKIPGFLKIFLASILLLFFVLPGLIGRLEILKRSGRRALSPGFVAAMIFHHFLGLDFVHDDVSGLTSLEVLEIRFSHIRTWL